MPWTAPCSPPCSSRRPKVGLKGIVSKRQASTYSAGPSRDWVKRRHRLGGLRTGIGGGCFKTPKVKWRYVTFWFGSGHPLSAALSSALLERWCAPPLHVGTLFAIRFWSCVLPHPNLASIALANRHRACASARAFRLRCPVWWQPVGTLPALGFSVSQRASQPCWERAWRLAVLGSSAPPQARHRLCQRQRSVRACKRKVAYA